jgi:glycosyltransferase involved in cell wall biosynthesis
MRKNVLIFNHGYKDGFIEASNQYTRLFDPEHYEVTVVYFDGAFSEEVQKKHIAPHVIFLNIPPDQKRGLKLLVIKKMLTLNKTKKFHIVICHRYKPTYIMLWVAKFSKIPAMICVMHEMGTFNALSRKLLVAALAQHTTMFAGVSNAVRDDIKNSVIGSIKNRITTLYNAIDVHSTEAALFSRIQARKKLNLSEDCFVYGILSRLVPAKDHNTLIKAFAIIKTHSPQAKLIIIGEGELKPVLKKQIIEIGLTNNIILTGFLPDAFTLLPAFDVFVLSSIREAFGRVLLEAMIAKCPIIATRTNGIPEVLGETGIIVEKQNPEALAAAMLKFYNLSAAEKERESILSYQQTVQHFSMEKFKESFWKLPMLDKNSIS